MNHKYKLSKKHPEGNFVDFNLIMLMFILNNDLNKPVKNSDCQIV